MATRKKTQVAQAAAKVTKEITDVEYAAAAANIDIVRAAGIVNGMPAEEVRARILAVAGKG